MKKNIKLAGAFFLAVSVLTACGDSTATDNATDKSSEAVVDSTALKEAIDELQNGPDDSTAQTQTDAASEAASTLDVSSLETMNLAEVTASDYVTLGDYKGLNVEVAALKEVTDEDVEARLEEVYAEDPQYQVLTEGTVKNGDIANIDFVGKYADTLEAFEGGTSEGFDLTIGSGQFIPGFEEGLVGVNIGETVDLDLTFPEQYQSPDLAGKAVVFTVTVNSVKSAVEEPTDAWVEEKGLEDATNLAEFKEHLRKELEEEREQNYTNSKKSAVLDVAEGNATYEEIPEKLYNRYLAIQYSQWNMQAQWLYYMYQVQMTPEQVAELIMQQNGLSGTVDDYIKDTVTLSTREFLFLQAVADQEGLTVSDEELDEAFKAEFEASAAAANSTYEDYKATQDIEYYRDTMMANKVVDFLVENTTFTDVEE
jgi:trigger factor